MNSNNKIVYSGEVVNAPVFSHETVGERFFVFYVMSQRKTQGAYDVVKVVISENVVDLSDIKIGNIIDIDGEIRTCNDHSDGKSHVLIFIFAKEIKYIGESRLRSDANYADLVGFICREPKHRYTPLGREITDFTLAVNRQYGKSDYVPCIAWGRAARRIANAPVGSMVTVNGRLQSRTYTRRHEDGTEEEQVAYELSCSAIWIDESTANSAGEKGERE